MRCFTHMDNTTNQLFYHYQYHISLDRFYCVTPAKQTPMLAAEMPFFYAGWNPSKNQGERRSSHRLVAQCTHSRKHPLSMPNTVRHQPYPWKRISFVWFRGECWLTSSVPARVAGMSCHGSAPMALMSPSGVSAYSNISFHSTLGRPCLMRLRTSVISVTNIPGAIAFARMLYLAYSDDRVFVKWFRAALLAL